MDTATKTRLLALAAELHDLIDHEDRDLIETMHNYLINHDIAGLERMIAGHQPQ